MSLKTKWDAVEELLSTSIFSEITVSEEQFDKIVDLFMTKSYIEFQAVFMSNLLRILKETDRNKITGRKSFINFLDQKEIQDCIGI